jgi:MoaA/NifB/PqqE/SkfB family radical SAM enzyme
MPGSSIANGHLGAVAAPRTADLRQYMEWVDWGTGLETHLSPDELACRTAGRHLHVCELWLPGGCNLRCKHCYVASWEDTPSLTADELAALTRRLVRQGLVDVVIPGMEPLRRPELWPIIEAAREEGARSIGITTNGTLLKRNVTQLLESGLTVMNVSLDGPEHVHNALRGKGVFGLVARGIGELRRCSQQLRLITNTTLTTLNVAYAVEMARIAADFGADFAAFHPFERSAEIDNSLAITASEAADAYEALIEAFRRGETGSVVVEAEASTFDVLLELAARGRFDDLTLVSDDTGYLFFYEAMSGREFLVNLMGYPHHFIRTIRVANDGGLSSCRNMAHTGWSGMGDLRATPLGTQLVRPDVLASLAMIWTEFRQAAERAPQGSIERYLEELELRAAQGEGMAGAAVA